MVGLKVLDWGMAIAAWLGRSVRRPVSILFYPLVDYSLLSLALVAVLVLLESFNGLAQYSVEQLLWCLPAFIALFLAGAYASVWSKARLSEYVFIALALLVSVAVSFGVELLFGTGTLRENIVKAVLFLGLSASFVFSVRIFPRIIRDLIGPNFALKGGSANRKHERVLVYGAGVRCRQYLESVGRQRSGANSALQQVIGLIDDEKNLRKRYVQGYQVLGGGDELPECLSEQKVDKIVLACSLTEQALKDLLESCTRERVSLSVYKIHEHQAYARLSQKIEVSVVSDGLRSVTKTDRQPNVLVAE